MLPLLVKLKIVEGGRSKVNVWFPVILIWILLLAVLLLLLPFVLIAAALTWRWGHGKALLALYPMLFAVLFNLSGLHIEAGDSKQSVLIIFP